MLNYTIMHLETANKNKESLCSLCLIDYENEKEILARHWFIKPPVIEFDVYSQQQHSITENDLSDKKSIYDLWDEIAPCLEGKTILSFNANNDVACLYKSFEYHCLSLRHSENKKLPVFEFISLHTLAYQIYNNLEGTDIISMCKCLNHIPDKANELSKARGVAFLFNFIVSNLQINDFYTLKRRADISFGERFNYMMHYSSKAHIIESLKPYLLCLPRHGKPLHKKISISSQWEQLEVSLKNIREGCG